MLLPVALQPPSPGLAAAAGEAEETPSPPSEDPGRGWPMRSTHQQGPQRLPLGGSGTREKEHADQRYLRKLQRER